MAVSTFLRFEQKYQINQSQKEELVSFFKERLLLDPYCKNESYYLVENIYLDSPGDDLIRSSLAKPSYKEKFRLRHYSGQEDMFMEIKKKLNGLGSKRRVAISNAEANAWLEKGIPPIRETYLDKQIVKEMDYLIKFYHLEKKVFISYQRLSFLEKDSQLRVTIDKHLIYRHDRLDFENHDGKPLIPEEQYILEIKNDDNLPFWLIEKLESLNLSKSSFSKYGKEHLQTIQGGKTYVI